MNALSLAEVGSLLVIELDGGRVYLNDGGEPVCPPRARRDPGSPGGRAERLRRQHGLRAAAAPQRHADGRDRDRAPGPRPHRQSSEVYLPRLGCARRCPRLVFRPQDDTAQHEVGERRHLQEERLGLVLEPFQAA